MFPHQPNNSIVGVRLRGGNGRIPIQNVHQVPRQEFLSGGFAEGQLPCQGSLQEPDVQRLGGNEKATGFSNVKYAHQQQHSFQQERQERRSEFIEQQKHVRQELDCSRQQNMQRLAQPETSYSALLHGPDTPPFHPEPAWDTSVEGEHCGKAADFSWPPKAVIVKDPACFDRCEGPLKPLSTQHLRSEQIRTEQKHAEKVSHRVSEGFTYSMKGTDVNQEALFNPNMGLQKQHTDHHSIEQNRPPTNLHHSNFQQGFHDPRVSQEHLPYQEWDGEKHNSCRPFERASLQSNGQSSMQSQQHVLSFDLERKDVNCSQPQSLEGMTEESVFKQQEGLALPSREIPGHIPNGFDLQQYNAWNVMHSQSISRAYGNHMQHAAETTYNRWNTSAWQESHPFMENSAYLPYGPSHMQMGPNHAPHDWQAHSTGTMADAYLQRYPEGYYSYGNSGMRQEANFIGVGETDSAVPSLFETYGQHYQGPQVYLSPVDQFLPRFGAPMIGAGCNNNLNETSGPLDLAIQKNHETLVNTGGQVQPRQLQGTRLKHSVNLVKKSRQELTVKNGSADKESFSHEKEAELEGPQLKKLRECSEADAYHFKSCQSSGKFSPQLGAGSSLNVAEISGVDGAPSSQNSFDVQGSTIHSSVKDCQSQSLSQGHGFEIGTDQQGQFSDTGPRMFQRSHMPGQMLNRNHTGSTSSVCSFGNGAGLPQSGFVPEGRFVPGVQQLQEYGVNNGFIPGGSHNGYREEFCSTRTNSSVSTSQDQSAADLLMRQSRDRAQVGSLPSVLTPSKTSTFQQLARPAVALESVFPVKGSSSDAATQEPTESHCTMFKPRNIGEGPGFLSTSSLRYQDTKAEQYAYGNPGHNYSSFVDGGEYFIPNSRPEVEQQRTAYPVSDVYPGHLQPQVQGKQFEHSKMGLLETGAQLKGFSRLALGKFYPPPPFHSHHLQSESGRVTNTRSEGEAPSEAWASGNFESGMVTSGMKEIVPKPVNYQANAGYMVEGGALYPAADGSGVMTRGSVLSDSAQVHQLPVSSLEVGSVSTPQPDNMLLYAHAPKSIPSCTHSSSITVHSQGSAGPAEMLRDNERSKASQAFGYTDPLVTGRTLRQANGDEHPSGHFSDIHNMCREYSTLRAAVSGKPLSERIPRQAFKPNLRAPLTMQQKKRKKPVPYLIPWHIVTAQPRGQLPSISKAELMWATATNRLSDKDGGEVSNLGIFSAESRLRLTTQLMQQIFSPLPSVLIHGKQPASLECGVYNLAKSALGEACRLMAGTDREIEPAQNSTDLKLIASNGQKRTWNMAKEVAMTKLVERFMERVKRLDSERARLDCSMSVLELRGKSHDFERLSIVHRLGKHHGPDFSMNLSENKLVDAITNHGPLIRKIPPQRYVIAVPMPRTLPEGARCLSL